MIEDSREKPLADPDFFDVLIQSLSVLSNIAALVATWKLLQPQQRPANAHNQGMIRDQLRTVERCFDDVFEAARRFANT